MKIEKKKKDCADAGCNAEVKESEQVKEVKEVEETEEATIEECDSTKSVESSESVESVEDINDVEEESTEDVEAKKNLGLAKQFYSLAYNHVKNAIDALGDAANSGDKYAKQEIADLSVILLDLQNLQRMG